MAWQDEMGQLLRVMIWDISTPQLYPDSSLQQVLVGAAQLVGTELAFTQTFVADIPNLDILPDPTDKIGGTRDDNFVNLVCMKSAAIVDAGVVRTQSGIVIRDNGSMVDLRAKLAAALKMIEIGWAKTYEEQKFIYQAGLDGVIGMAVLGPFRAMAGEYYGWTGNADYPPREGAWLGYDGY
jgi:hypothetical protein